MTMKIDCRRFLMLMVLVAGLIPATQCFASCTATGGSPSPLPIDFNYSSSIYVERSLPAGSAIPGTQRDFSISGTCDSQSGVGTRERRIVACLYEGTATEIPGMPGVYTTGLGGVGVAIRDTNGTRLSNAQGNGCAAVMGMLQSNGGSASQPWRYDISGSMELVKTTPAGQGVTGGTLNPNWAKFGFGVYFTQVMLNTNVWSDSYIAPTGAITILSASCSVDAPSSVRLPEVKAADFPAVGSGAGETPFKLGVTCDQNVRANVMFAAASGIGVVDAASGTLGLQAMAGTATGYGMQLLRTEGAPLPLGVRLPLGALTANTPAWFDFAVRYQRIAASTSPGPATSAAVFTLDYE